MCPWLKKQFTVSSLVLSLLNAFLIYFLIDASVTIDYRQQGLVYQEQRTDLLRNMLKQTCRNISRAELAGLLKRRFEDGHIIEEGEDKVRIDDITFQFKGESFEDIYFLDE